VPAMELKRLSPPLIPHLIAVLPALLYPRQRADGKLAVQDLASGLNRVILTGWTLAHRARHPQEMLHTSTEVTWTYL
jgi:hypothetical protein